MDTFRCQNVGRVVRYPKHPISITFPAPQSNIQLTVVQCLEAPHYFLSDAFYLIKKCTTQPKLYRFIVLGSAADIEQFSSELFKRIIRRARHTRGWISATKPKPSKRTAY